MGAVRGVIVGSVGLVTLYNLTEGPASGVSTLFGLPGRAAQWLVSPAVPLIPDLRTGAAVTDPKTGDTTGTNSGGDTVTQHPDGSTTIGGPNGIPVLPTGDTSGTVSTATLAALNPTATTA